MGRFEINPLLFYQAVLYGRESLMRDLVNNVKEFDTQSGKLWPTGEESLMASPVLDSILSWYVYTLFYPFDVPMCILESFRC